MKWYYKQSGDHTHVRVMINGALSGNLVFKNEEFKDVMHKMESYAPAEGFFATFIDETEEKPTPYKTCIVEVGTNIIHCPLYIRGTDVYSENRGVLSVGYYFWDESYNANGPFPTFESCAAAYNMYTPTL
jgi:hypothetical protein